MVVVVVMIIDCVEQVEELEQRLALVPTIIVLSTLVDPSIPRQTDRQAGRP